jgi:ribosome recycling factor
VRKKLGILSRKRAEFGALTLEGEIEPLKVETFERCKAELQEGITALQEEIAALKAERKATKRHIPFHDLPEEERFQRLSTQSKHFIDTIKMVAYRAETAMAQTLREKMARYDDARSLLRAVYSSEIDLLPNAKDKTLTVRLHPLANESSDEAVRHLCAELNRTELFFPGTELRLVYALVSSHNR